MVAAARILVVDDEPLVTKGCRRILADAGYQVDTAATGQEGLNRAFGESFDLVMADLKLPDADGMDLVRALRSERPETRIVIITGYGSVPSAVEAVKLGVSDYIEKPFTPEQVTEAIGRALQEDQGQEKLRIEASLVREVLSLAATDQGFGQRLLAEGSRVLSGFALSTEAKAAIVAGDIAWIEKECGELLPEEREWLERRLEAEAY
jgi:DNA-binding NtrC family response regulator